MRKWRSKKKKKRPSVEETYRFPNKGSQGRAISFWESKVRAADIRGNYFEYQDAKRHLEKLKRRAVRLIGKGKRR